MISVLIKGEIWTQTGTHEETQKKYHVKRREENGVMLS